MSPGKVGASVQKVGQRRTGNVKSGRSSRYREFGGLNNLGPNEIPRMGRLFHGHGALSVPSW
jgi:hypothetical protein